MAKIDDTVRWYAAKVFWNRITPIKEQLIEDKIEFFVPEIIGSLVFLQSTLAYVKNFESQNFGRLWCYKNPDSKDPAAIPTKEMEMFIFICTAGKQGLTYLGDDKPAYHQGDKVRVIDGPFKGAEGYIKRIKKDRKLIVSVSGVAAVATSYIPPQYLEIITKK